MIYDSMEKGDRDSELINDVFGSKLDLIIGKRGIENTKLSKETLKMSNNHQFNRKTLLA